MNTYWIKVNRLLLLMGALLVLTSCQEVIDEAPQILNMSIEGIPQQNITIDQAQRLITVVLPPSLPSLELVPSFTFSRQAHLADPVTVNLTKYCPCRAALAGGDYKTVARLVDRVDNKHQSTHYTFVFKSGGPLRIKPLSAPLVYDVITNNKPLYLPLHVPVENYYGSAYVQYISVTPSGSPSPNWLGPDGGCMESCATMLNEISLSLSGYLVGGLGSTPQFSSLKPGLHDLDLWLADGTKVHAEGAILVK